MIWIWLSVGLICVLMFIWLTRVTIDVYYAYLHKKQTVTVKINVFTLTVYTFRMPVVLDRDGGVVVKEKKKTLKTTKRKKKRFSLMDLIYSFQSFQEWITFLLRLHKDVQPIFKMIKLHTLDWKTEFGLGDAPLTAQATGHIWFGKSLIIGLMSRYVTVLTPPTLHVAPMYQQNLAHTEFCCMFSFRIGHAIHAAITVLRHWRQRPNLSKK